jgi:hypothetical protein
MTQGIKGKVVVITEADMEKRCFALPIVAAFLARRGR